VAKSVRNKKPQIATRLRFRFRQGFVGQESYDGQARIQGSDPRFAKGFGEASKKSLARLEKQL